MDKAHWQVTTGLLALTTIGSLFGVIANKSVVRQLTEELKAAQHSPRDAEQECAEPSPASQTVHVVKTMPVWPDGADCRGGRMLLKTDNGWQSLTYRGEAMSCYEQR